VRHCEDFYKKEEEEEKIFISVDFTIKVLHTFKSGITHTDLHNYINR